MLNDVISGDGAARAGCDVTLFSQWLPYTSER
jgi:hypothetical protein